MRPEPRDIANHLAYLAQTLNLSTATLKTRRAAKGDKSIASNPLVSAVLKGIANMSHKTKTLTPKWDLAVVLNFLKSPTMRDNKSLDFKFLILKTVFLVALASGR